jgi:transcriptional regulator with XRE-family HTH domain
MRPKRFSDQIRRAVDDSGLSRYRVCAEIRLSQAAMSRFMASKSGLAMDTLDRLADVLGLTVVTRPVDPKTRK